MALLGGGKKWHEVVPLDEIFGDASSGDPNAPLLVDIGGNTGYDLAGFHKANPDRRGRLILQDLPVTVAKVDAAAIAPIEPMGHDFFQPQPVHGARVYYFKAVLHNWDDESCQKILSNVKSAMTPGHSRILANEIVIPDTVADWPDTSLDILMMKFLNSLERSAKEWDALAAAVGLRVNRIWDGKNGPHKLIEMVLA